MDRRSFLKLGALFPIAKSVIDKLIADRELALDDIVDWHDPVIIGGPEPIEELVIDWKASLTTDAIARDVIYYDGGSCEGIFAPDPDRIGEFVEVGRTSPLLACACYPGLDIQIKTGHCDESENLLDL